MSSDNGKPKNTQVILNVTHEDGNINIAFGKGLSFQLIAIALRLVGIKFDSMLIQNQQSQQSKIVPVNDDILKKLRGR